MATKEDAALLSLYVYNASEKNAPLRPPQWSVVQDRTEGTSGFAYAIFKNTTTQEVVVAFRGTDNDLGDWLTNFGLSTAQEQQAAAVCASALKDYPGQVTFTGHSLGGGLAATMAVWFDRPAIVFDPAPCQAVATSYCHWSPAPFSPPALRDHVCDGSDRLVRAVKRIDLGGKPCARAVARAAATAI